MSLDTLRSKFSTLAVLLFLLVLGQGVFFLVFILQKLADDLGATVGSIYLIVGLFATAMPVIIRLSSTDNEFRWTGGLLQTLLIPWAPLAVSLVRKVPFDYDASVGAATVLWYVGSVVSLVIATVLRPKTVKLHYKVGVSIVACAGLSFLYLLLWSEDWLGSPWEIASWHAALIYDVFVNTALYVKMQE